MTTDYDEEQNPEYPSGEPAEHSITMLWRVRVKHVRILDGGHRFVSSPADAQFIVDSAQTHGFWTATAEKPWGMEIDTSLAEDFDPGDLYAFLRRLGDDLSGDPERFGFAPDPTMATYEASQQLDDIRHNLGGEVGYQGYEIDKMHLEAPVVLGPFEVYVPVRLELRYR